MAGTILNHNHTVQDVFFTVLRGSNIMTEFEQVVEQKCTFHNCFLLHQGHKN